MKLLYSTFNAGLQHLPQSRVPSSVQELRIREPCILLVAALGAAAPSGKLHEVSCEHLLCPCRLQSFCPSIPFASFPQSYRMHAGADILLPPGKNTVGMNTQGCINLHSMIVLGKLQNAFVTVTLRLAGF